MINATIIEPIRFIPNNDILTQIFNAFGALFGGITLGFIIVSYMVYPIGTKIKYTRFYLGDDYDSDEDDNNDVLSENEQRKNQIKLYSNKYFDELSSMPSAELSEAEIKNLRQFIIEDETPYGKISMTYNSDTESFWWFSDSEHSPYITYIILDTVARLFAITYNCKQICVNYKEEWEKERKIILEKIRLLKEKAENINMPMPPINFTNFPIVVQSKNSFTLKYELSELLQLKNKTDHSLHHQNTDNPINNYISDDVSTDKLKYSDYKKLLDEGDKIKQD